MKPAVFFLSTVSLLAQIRMQPPFPPREQTGKASIEGNVLDAVTREPVKKAAVMLNGTISLTAVTDASGHFAFRALPAGNYMILANSEKYAGQQSFNADQQVTCSLSADEQKRDVALTLTPGASIRGQIVDEEGSPMPRCQIRAMRFQDSDMGRSLETLASVQSDDHGEYRMSNIPAGKYYVMAHCSQSVQLPHAFIQRGAVAELPVLTYPQQFYPGAPDPMGASRVAASPNANITGIDFHMFTATGVTVRGQVRPTAPDRNLQIALQPKDRMRRWQWENPRFNAATGAFQFPNVMPGSYELVATAFGDGHSHFALVPVEVGTTPLEPVDMVLTAGAAISGTISIEGDVKVAMNSMHVMVQSLDPWPMGAPPPQAEVHSDGTFTLNSVVPGHRRLVVDGGPGYVKSVTYGDQEVSPVDFEIGGSAGGSLKIVMGTKFAQVDAALSSPPPDSGPVFAIFWPANGDFTHQQNVGLSPQAHALLANIPPGKYYGCAMAVAQPWMIVQNHALLKALESTCEAVDVVEGGRTSVQLRLISAQDLKRFIEKLDDE
jgi:Carboxypeptidase regulatory-like domain